MLSRVATFGRTPVIPHGSLLPSRPVSPLRSHATRLSVRTSPCCHRYHFTAISPSPSSTISPQVERYLSRLSAEVLGSPPVQFVLKVARARTLKQYATFFRLLREAAYLPACCMFKYVCEMRLQVRLERCLRRFNLMTDTATHVDVPSVYFL